MIKYFLLTIITYVTMEGVTWLTHKFVMHGLMWSFHEDHHDPRKKPHPFFERNDTFFFIFAFPSITMFLVGTLYPEFAYLNAIALGITMYGLTYFLIHEVLIHRRLKFMDGYRKFSYLRGLIRAHKVHHKHLGKEDGECFGLLLVPKKFFNRN